jgi:hypothetical protein
LPYHGGTISHTGVSDEHPCNRALPGPRLSARGVPNWERRDVTVGIAAVCDQGTADPKIVLCTDTKVGDHLGSIDMLKTRPLNPANWVCLTSGIDTDILPTWTLLKAFFTGAQTIDETNVLSLIRNALNRRKLEKTEEFVQGKYAVSYAEFIQRGKSLLPEDQFGLSMAAIELTNTS